MAVDRKEHLRRQVAGLPKSAWFTSSRTQQNECVEVAYVDGGVVVRDTKDREGPVLHFNPGEWEAFVGGVKDGEFDIT